MKTKEHQEAIDAVKLIRTETNSDPLPDSYYEVDTTVIKHLKWHLRGQRILTCRAVAEEKLKALKDSKA